ncbi:bifunctional diaminohydroxyphosphoribosylaminopyrimidine deaminase/5-amino-6-(5-phosphoribosylamino)uracil reductase RibD [Celerinatantimonas yamalensis]|uniref:Riboflavin biosynthesis protein RibD n=1 Tax=Celerinatantimonas yamalensis TaxID=559956 RepID=A0ABW9GAW9_9GAMM
MSDFSAQDYAYMARALQLAAKGRFSSAPNPNVGCVLVKAGQIIGEGYHLRAGEPHAEINAMQDALAKGHSLSGASCYVSLEPCCHYGRTPPCAKALIEAEIATVVMAMRDPNPQVAGGGMTMLQAAGVSVKSGLLAVQAERLNAGFLMRMRVNRPRVRLKIAVSLDGRTALANGQSQWITSPLSRQDVQKERAQSHAILSTAETVIADDASLNVRLTQLSASIKLPEPIRQPVRVIIDRRQQLTGQERLFSLPGLIIHVVDKPALRTLGQSLVIPACENWLAQVLSVLAAEQINDLWVEAGATFSGALLEAGLVDELVIYQASLSLGCHAREMAVTHELSELSQATRWRLIEQRRIGDDLKYIYQPKEANSCLQES